jgi:hemin uptake protein HemP
MHDVSGDPKGPRARGDEGRERAVSEKVPVLLSSSLLGSSGLVHIDHAGEIYTLRRTRNGRLLLTK